jgi:acetylglutamate kinase
MKAFAEAEHRRGRLAVVKLGGSALEDDAAKQDMLRSLVVLQKLGVAMIAVHGGGKPIDRAMADAGMTPVKVQGRRYTDAESLAIVHRVLMAINQDLVSGLKHLGGQAIGWSTATPAQYPVSAERLFLPGLDLQPIDLGFVGRVTEVDRVALQGCLTRKLLPILPCLAVESNSPDQWLNINADSLASGVAASMKADTVLFLTDTPGVYADRARPESLCRRLSRAECQAMIASEVIAGGMIPKVEACFDAIDAGATEAIILDGRQPGCLIHWLLGEPSGTVIVS